MSVVIARDGAMTDSIAARRAKPIVSAPPAVLDITVLMGGPSSERDVSIVSGTAVADALERLGHKVVRSDISSGQTAALDRKGIDVVFIALHGAFGEDGKVQQLCQDRGLRYIGSGPQASRTAMDKASAKAVFARAGLFAPAGALVERPHTPAQRQALLDALDLPVVVKPVDGGSSVDVTITDDADIRDRAVDAMVARYGCSLVEKFIQGREFTVGILGDEALPALEIVASRGFYEYDAKYADGSGTRYVFDHGLPAQVVRAMQSAALTAHRSLDCRDLSRVDFILDAAGVPYVLEINTIPGFTSHSLLPMAAARTGISFDQLVQRIVQLAMQRG